MTALPLVVLPAGSFVIGDCHLDAERERASAEQVAFENWLSRRPKLPALVILGDLFDVYRGPSSLRRGAARGLCAALAACAQRGTQVHVLHGNRDFLLGAEFTSQSGARLWPRGFVARVGDSATGVLLLHGDELCTLDRGYQRLKRVLRHPLAVGLARARPGGVSRVLAKRLRRTAKHSLQRKPRQEVEQQSQAVEAALLASGARVCVVGHAHRFSDRDVEVRAAVASPAASARWVVLDAFGQGRDCARLEAGGAVEIERSDAASS